MGEVITNLKAKFSVDSQNVGKGLKPGQDALADLDRKVAKSIDGLKGMLTPLALLGAAGGALAAFRSAVDSIEGPGERMAAVMGGVKESLFEAGKALATLDFSSFIENLDVGYERGKRLTELLDDLGDRAAYNDYRINQLSRESAGLKEIVNNKTLELAVRAEAATRIEAIEEKIRDRRIELAREEFNIQREFWEGRNKMDADQALALYESIDAMAPEVKDRLQGVFKDAMAGSLGVKAAEYSYKIVTSGLKSYDDTLYQEVPQEVIESYGKYFLLVEKGERDVLQKLFNTYNQIEEVGYKAQEDYNATVSQTTELLAQEKKAVDQLALARSGAAADLLKEMKDTNKMEGPLDPYSWAPTDLTMSLAPVTAAVVTVKDEISETVFEIKNIIEEGMSQGMEGFAMWVGEFAAGAEGIDALGKLVGTSLGGMLIQLGKTLIQTGIGIEAIKAAFGKLQGVGAIAVGLSLIAFGAAISASVRSIPGNSTSSSAGSSGGPFVYDNRILGGGNEKATLNHVVTIRAKGSDLVGVIEIENRRKRAST